MDSVGISDPLFVSYSLILSFILIGLISFIVEIDSLGFNDLLIHYNIHPYCTHSCNKQNFLFIYFFLGL